MEFSLYFFNASGNKTPVEIKAGDKVEKKVFSIESKCFENSL